MSRELVENVALVVGALAIAVMMILAAKYRSDGNEDDE